MIQYIIRRMLLVIPTIFIVSIVVFVSVRFLPGDIVELMLAEQGGLLRGTKAREHVEELLGLDVPAHVQYLRWVGGIVFHGSLGDSLTNAKTVTQLIGDRLPVTLELGALSMLVSLAIGIPIGIYSSIRQDTIGDYIGRSIAIVAISVPHFWLGIMVFLYPSIHFNWSPRVQYVGFFEDPMANLGMMIIPATILGLILSGQVMRMMRTTMLEVLRQDYVRTAYSKGLRERVVINRHALKNAMIPVVTLIGISLPFLIGGSLVIEQIFALPGLGRLMLTSLEARDYTTVSGINLVVALFVILFNVVIDISYSWLDPRIRQQ